MESSPQVNLYIETTVHGPRQQGGRWMYLLEFVTRRGDPVTLWKVGDWEAEKENVLIMQALSAALDRLRLPCVINAHTGSSQIRSTIENGWLEEWQERGWRDRHCPWEGPESKGVGGECAGAAERTQKGAV